MNPADAGFGQQMEQVDFLSSSGSNLNQAANKEFGYLGKLVVDFPHDNPQSPIVHIDLGRNIMLGYSLRQNLHDDVFIALFKILTVTEVVDFFECLGRKRSEGIEFPLRGTFLDIYHDVMSNGGKETPMQLRYKSLELKDDFIDIPKKIDELVYPIPRGYLEGRVAQLAKQYQKEIMAVLNGKLKNPGRYTESSVLYKLPEAFKRMITVYNSDHTHH